MLKVYSKTNYQDFNEFKARALEEAKSLFGGHDASYRGFAVTLDEFKLEYVYFGTVATEIIRVYLGDGNCLGFLKAVNSGVLVLEDSDVKAFKEFDKIIEDAKLIHQEELAEAKKELERQQKIAYQEYLKREAEKAELKKAQEEEKKYQARIDRALKKLDTLKPEKTERLFNSPTTYYEALGWMAKHTTSVRAAMPDYMEKWFDSKFDCQFKYVVNSKKRTSGGHPVQWGLSFRMSFDSEVSGILEQRATSQNKKVIDNVAFVWDLIENYGFQFLKTSQDVERIRAEIPKDYIADFERGLAM